MSQRPYLVEIVALTALGMTACGEVVRTISDGAVEDPVFVSSSRGDDANLGAKPSPVKTLGHALAIANGRAIAACGETFDESIVVPSGSTLHGALDCTQDWAYVATMPSCLIAAADSIPLTLAGGSATTTVTDFDVEAFDTKLAGGSSLAVLVNTGSVELDHCRVIAGAGSNGVAGSSQPPVAASPNGLPGIDDGQCFMANPTAGGNGGVQSCGAIDVSGGAGGTGTTTTFGGNGIAGLPSGVGTYPSDGGPGNGQGLIVCAAGHPGATGPAGVASNGAHGLGTLSASGFTAPLASDASPGSAGQGGGGGGGAKQCGQIKAGSSGGGGGGGGCGGNPGNAGSSGGSSLGIVAVSANLTLHDVTITTGAAGDGGAGGDGQQGGLGGQPGGGGNTGACGGGAGGSGGHGGSGGGGAGGLSIGVAFVGSAPDLGTVNVAVGTAGNGALGGDASTAARGDDGKACKALDFANESACVQ